LVELAGSHIPAPPSPVIAAVPPEAYHAVPKDPTAEATPAGDAELRRLVTRLLDRPSPLLKNNRNVDTWMDAWKEFDVGAK